MKDGGPAFPYEYKYGDGTAKRAEGMSLRAYFAGQAMQGLLANSAQTGWIRSELAQECCVIADAMIAELDLG